MCVCVQIHRRGRALRKLAKQLTEGTVVMTPWSLQNYIMPYAMTALLDEKMVKVGRSFISKRRRRPVPERVFDPLTSCRSAA